MKKKVKEVKEEEVKMLENLTSNTEFKEKLKKVIDETDDLKNVVNLIDNEVEEQLSDSEFYYSIKGFKEDVAYHLNQSIIDILGFSSLISKEMSGKSKPSFINVDFGDGTYMKVPYGKINLPMLSESSYIDVRYSKEDQVMNIQGVTEKRFLSKLDSVIKETTNRVKNNSIYSGKAIALDKDLNIEFINLEGVKNTPLILNDSTNLDILPITSRIENTDELIKNKVDIKYGVILSGVYGTGKTLLAFKLAEKATANNWTFIYSKESENTYKALEIANRLADSGRGVVLFNEDIDLVLKDERDSEMNRILNIMDGGDNKRKNIISIFTTNHLNKINPTFLRGKRIGSLIEMTHLDRKASSEFLNFFLKDLLPKNSNIEESLDLIEEYKIVPAFLSEIVEKVKTTVIYNKNKKIKTSDVLLSTIKSYIRQITLVNEASKEKVQDEIQFIELYKKLFINNKQDKDDKNNEILEIVKEINANL
jgi:transitional endoplasmic reticulum ATPase